MTSTTEHPTLLPPCRPDLAEAWRDWQPMEALLSWLERLRTLPHDTGGMTDDDDLLMNPMARALLTAAAGTLDRAVPVPPSPVVPDAPVSVMPVPPLVTPPETPADHPRAPKPTSRNGHRAPAPEKATAPTPTPVRWSLNERLQELGYEDLDRSTRIRLGQAVVEAYKQARGKAPAIADRGSGVQSKRVALYEADDGPLVDGVVREMLGDAPGVPSDADMDAREAS